MTNEAGFAVQKLSTARRRKSTSAKGMAEANLNWRHRSPLYRDQETSLPTMLGPYQIEVTADGWCLMDEFSDKLELISDDIFEAFRAMLDRYEQWYLSNDMREVGQPRVYFIGTTLEIGRFVKIGVSIDPARRLKTLQTASPEPLVILATVEGDKALESYYHQMHSASRCEGEWFKLTKDLIRDIRDARKRS